MADSPTTTGIRLEDHVPQSTASPPDNSQAGSSTHSPEISQPTEHIDILYENQRGWFACGIPLFSSNSLLNFDPKAWVTSTQTPSPVNITNAQVPDPSWEWAWKTWYVDMSNDVDEEGWEYSVWFRGFSWHGSHPWFHSFVRRRRWLRRRVKKKTAQRKGMEEGRKVRSDGASIGTTLVPSTFVMNTRQATTGPEGMRPEIADVPSLMKALKQAPIDREKIVVVREFLKNGGEELHYLEEQIPTIMSQLVFQNSRRNLLTLLTAEIDAVTSHRASHVSSGKTESDEERRRIDNLLKAVKAADEQCRKLEYWSDIRHMVREGKAPAAVDTEKGWGDGWQGVDASGPGHDEHDKEEPVEGKEQVEKDETIRKS